MDMNEVEMPEASSQFDTAMSSACLHLGTGLMKSTALPEPGQKVTIKLTGTVKSVEQSKPEGVGGMLGELEFDVTEVSFSQLSDFSALLDD